MIKEYMQKLGIHHFGTALIPEGLRPFRELPYAISLGVPLSKTVVSSIRSGPTHTYFHHYRTTNAYLDQTALKIMLFIESLGCNAVYIPASQTVDQDGMRALFSHKMAAALAGLGGIGQNALFLSAQYGPALRLSTVLTDYPLQTAARPLQSPCTNCGACVSACPSGALTGTQWSPGLPREELIDAKKCSLHMKKAYRHIGRGAVCGVCIAACPLCNAD